MKRQAQRHGWLWYGLIGFLLLLLSACGGGGGTDDGGGDGGGGATAPAIGLNLTSVAFTSADLSDRTVILSNTGDQTMNWSLSAPSVNWFSVAPSGAQTLAGHATANLTVSLVGIYVPTLPGTYTGSFNVTSTNATNGPQTVNVSLVIAAPGGGPSLSASLSTLTFSTTLGATPANQTIVLTNAGSGTLNWTATATTTSGGNWLSATTSTSGALGSGLTTNLTLKVTSATLAAGTYDGTVSLTSDGGNLAIPVTLTVSAPSQAASSTSIGGKVNVAQLSSLVASQRARKSAAVPGAQSTILTDAVVVVEVLRNSTTREYRTQTDANGNYKIQADVVSGDKVTINISKPGYVPFIETVTVTDQNLNSIFSVNGTVAPTNVVVVPLGTALKANGGSTPGFRFGMMRNRDGSLKAYRSSTEMGTLKASARVDGSAPFIDVSIPASRVGNDVTALRANMAGFDSTNPTDRAMFPGEFVGIGGGTAYASKANSTAYPLESVTFMQLDVKQDDGKEIQLTSPSAGSARAAAADPVTVLKWIPSDACGQMKKYADRDANTAGVQLPIYTYKSSSGEWGYLGEGTLKAWDNATQNYSFVPEGDVVANGKLENLLCGQKDYYFEIVVNTDWYTWWNLDYPIIFDISNKKTIHGKVSYDDGTPVAGTYVYANPIDYNLGGSTFYGYTDQDGNYSFDMLVDDVEFANYTFSAYNNKTWRDVAPQTPPSAGNNYTADFVFTNPYTCKATGAIKRDQTAIANEWVYTWTNSTGYWDYVQTGSDGRFTVSTPCGEEVSLWAVYQERVFNVNSTVGSSEQSDNGKVVVLKDMLLVNQSPEVYLSAWPTEVKAGDPIELWGWAWDPEYTAVSYAWSSDTNKTLNGNDYVLLDTTGLSGAYTVTLTASDADGKSASTAVTINVTAPGANKPPVLLDFNYYLDTWSSPDVCNPSVVLWSSAYDPEGDALSYNWSAPAGSFTDLGWGEFRWQNAGSAPQAVTLTVSDPQGAPSLPLTKTVTPQTQMVPQVWWVDVVPNPASVDTPVALYAYGWIENGANLDYVWTLKDPDNLDVTGLGTGPNPVFTPSKVGTYSGSVVATGCTNPSTAYNFSFAVTGGAALNTPPEIWYVGGYLYSQTEFVLAAYAWDADGDLLTYTWSDGGAGGTFTDLTGVGGDNSYVLWTAPAGFNGTVNFTATVSDGTDSTVSSPVTTTIDTTATAAPVVYDVWTQDYPVYAGGNGTTLYVYAVDLYGAALTYAWADVTEPGSIVTAGNAPDAPRWNPTIPGAHTLTVTVSNGTQQSTYTVTLYVESAPAETTVIIQ